MANRILIDTNVVVRFLTRDNEKYFLKSVAIFQDIEDGKMEAMLMDFIVAEIVSVLHRIYKHSKKEIATTLKKLLLYDHLYTENKLITFEALEIYAEKNIDFADAVLYAKQRLEGFEIISFDKDIEKC
ncbi:PIN domain-containing protein [Sulfurovum sp. NBC37-1]|uniref:PIN domain-containing protein n=1 Tax=Sulfurovum sp. (strain NBC37-1) TaxID=387093 RepID=UPI000158780A|nr:PIN domain-containing protein [Sulfurovum sp. NBC37-1]BAF71658.1 conserved hypothetical protein [Sulfurovum sp. NBC37-1]